MTPSAILIVDDNSSNLRLMEAVLEGDDFVIRTALDAEEAVGILKSFSPDLILMDIQLPGMDGLEFTRRLKTDPATAQIVVVALTAYAMKGDQEKALKAGCDGYVSKPIDTRALPGIIGRYLERRASFEPRAHEKS